MRQASCSRCSANEMTLAGVRGRLITAAFAEARLNAPGYDAPPSDVIRRLDAWSDRLQAHLGPASSVRSITDGAVIPLLRILGYDIGRRIDDERRAVLEAAAPEATIPVVVTGWSESLNGLWRGIVLGGIAVDGRWGFCCNGVSLRIVDARRTWSREYLEFDLALIEDDEQTRRLLWNLVSAQSMRATPSTLDYAVEQSARHGVAVRKALGDGVLNALT